jgi:glycosyltransferase involved in cell wall biosynthesis
MLQNYEHLEVLVSDDGSTDNTREVVEEASKRDPRIRYLTPSSGTGMLNNFEYVLQQVKPGFVIALGGDDGLLPDGIQGMWNTLRDTGMELLAWPAPHYFYPNVRGINSQITIFRDKGIKIIDSRKFLCRQAKELRYSSDRESPMFYVKGVASTTLIERVRQNSPRGRFYSCPTPDGYSGIVLAGMVDSYAYSGQPFSIFGSSPDSHGLAYLSNKETAKKISESFFQSVSSMPMHRELASQPYSPLITLMTADYLLTARDLPGWRGSFPPIDYRQVLIKGIMELSSGMYGEERMSRELIILNKIAEKHGLTDYFRQKVRTSNCYRPRLPYMGNGFNTDGFYLDGNAYHLNNVFDAAYVAQTICQLYADLSSSSFPKAIIRSIVYRFREMNRKGGSFPNESEWLKVR